MGKGFSFLVGATLGAAAGTIIGILIAPRAGAETRAMAADMANDAWDNARDMYEQGTEQARAAMNDFGPMVDAKTDELRAKVAKLLPKDRILRHGPSTTDESFQTTAGRSVGASLATLPKPQNSILWREF